MGESWGKVGEKLRAWLRCVCLVIQAAALRAAAKHTHRKRNRATKSGKRSAAGGAFSLTRCELPRAYRRANFRFITAYSALLLLLLILCDTSESNRCYVCPAKNGSRVPHSIPFCSACNPNKSICPPQGRSLLICIPKLF